MIGFLIGILPGAGSTIASFISYGVEKAVSKHPEKFGTGVVEGVAAPEGANNSETGGALVPHAHARHSGLWHDGDSARGAGAVGLQAGAAVDSDNPSLFWGLVASMYIGNVMLLILNLPLMPLFAQVLQAPRRAALPDDIRHLHRRRLQCVGEPVRRVAAERIRACSAT